MTKSEEQFLEKLSGNRRLKRDFFNFQLFNVRHKYDLYFFYRWKYYHLLVKNFYGGRLESDGYYDVWKDSSYEETAKAANILDKNIR